MDRRNCCVLSTFFDSERASWPHVIAIAHVEHVTCEYDHVGTGLQKQHEMKEPLFSTEYTSLDH